MAKARQFGKRRATAKVVWFGQYRWTARLTKCNDGTFVYDGLHDGDTTWTTFGVVSMGFGNYPQVTRPERLTGPMWDTLISLLRKLGVSSRREALERLATART